MCICTSNAWVLWIIYWNQNTSINYNICVVEIRNIHTHLPNDSSLISLTHMNLIAKFINMAHFRTKMGHVFLISNFCVIEKWLRYPIIGINLNHYFNLHVCTLVSLSQDLFLVEPKLNYALILALWSGYFLVLTIYLDYVDLVR